MNYYVMNENSQMVYRNTREGCIQWCQKMLFQFQAYGMRSPVYRVFYDSDTEPICKMQFTPGQPA